MSGHNDIATLINIDVLAVNATRKELSGGGTIRHPPLVSITNLADLCVGAWGSALRDPIGGYNLLTFPHATLGEHLTKTGVVAGGGV